MSGHSSFMTDHEEIRRWVEERNGRPATIAETAKKNEDAGLLHIDFPGGAKNPPLEPVSWEGFFEKFDKENLALVYQDETADGRKSYFCKFVSRESVEEPASR